MIDSYVYQIFRLLLKMSNFCQEKIKKKNQSFEPRSFSFNISFKCSKRKTDY